MGRIGPEGDVAMKTLFATALLIGSVGTANAQGYGYNYGTGSNANSHYTNGYTTNSGTYVQGHQSTNPNNTQRDNYGTSGNYNPYTGQTGSRVPRY